MKIPEPLFKLINLAVGLMLRSPVHRLASKSLMLITFTGRKSGKVYTTPIRYLHVDDKVRCFTSKSTGWWKNLVSNRGVTLFLAGESITYQAEVTIDDKDVIKDALVKFLAIYPQDSVYHDIRVEPDGNLNPADLNNALENTVLMDLTPAPTA